MMPYGIMDLSRHWFRLWLAAWWHQAIAWTNDFFFTPFYLGLSVLTHWGPVMEIWVNELIIASGNDMLGAQCQVITSTIN